MENSTWIASAELIDVLAKRLSIAAHCFLTNSLKEIRNRATAERRALILALVSRYVRSNEMFSPDGAECRALNQIATCDFERWTLLEALRIALLLASPDIGDDTFESVFEYCFRFADHGEACALYRSLPLLPRGERFAARAREGCRSNMRTIFEAVSCDSPYPAAHFDDVSWRQLVLKAVFIGAPLARVHGLDGRLSPELARMALDFADERRSAGRGVPPQLWLCIGRHGGERGLHALRRELAEGGEAEQRGALLGLARAGAMPRDKDWPLAKWETHAAFIERARMDGFTQHTFQLQ